MKKLKGNVVTFVRGDIGFGFRSGSCRRGRTRTWRGRSRTGITAGFGTPISAAEKLHYFANYAKFAALLAGLLVIPLVKAQPSFNENRTALAHVLRKIFSRAAKNIHINKGHLFLLFPSLIRPNAVDGQTDFGDGQAFGRIAQLGIACQIPDQNDFVEAGHGSLNYFAALGTAAFVNITRKTSSFSAKRLFNRLTALGSLSKITFT